MQHALSCLGSGLEAAGVCCWLCGCLGVLTAKELLVLCLNCGGPNLTYEPAATRSLSVCVLHRMHGLQLQAHQLKRPRSVDASTSRTTTCTVSAGTVYTESTSRLHRLQMQAPSAAFTRSTVGFCTSTARQQLAADACKLASKDCSR